MELCNKCGEYAKDCTCKHCAGCAAKDRRIKELEAQVADLCIECGFEEKAKRIKELEEALKTIKTLLWYDKQNDARDAATSALKKEKP